MSRIRSRRPFAPLEAALGWVGAQDAGAGAATAMSPTRAQLACPMDVGDAFTLFFLPPIRNAVSVMVFTRDLGSFRLARLGSFSGSGDGQAELVSQALLVVNDLRPKAFESFKTKPQSAEVAPFTPFVQVSGRILGFFDASASGCVAWMRAGISRIEGS